MKKLFLPFVSLSLVIMSSCGKAPDPDFEMSKNEAFVNESIQFTNKSTKALSYKWQFGDGSVSSDLENPSHTYTAAGVYEVSLKAFSKEDQTGFESSSTAKVYINNPEYFFKATINGQSINYTIGSEYSGLARNLYTGSGTDYNSTYLSIIRKSATSNSFGIYKGSISYKGSVSNPYPSNSVFQNYFLTQSYNYASSGSEGIQIIYYDANGKQWTSTGNQSGSSFAITERSISGADPGVIEYKASFNCKLYDLSGASINLSDGNMFYQFKNY